LFGIIISLTASIGFGSSSVFAKISMQKMQSGTTTLISLITSTIITLFVSTLFTQTEEYNKLNIEILMLLFYIGVLTYFFGRLLNYTSVQYIGVNKATPIIGTTPLFASLTAIIFMNEKITTPIMIGTALIIMGIILITRKTIDATKY
tara:strand:- start:51799 stop:52242 length:444 start_codon:yes stop_codon:yes gene_type:complete